MPRHGGPRGTDVDRSRPAMQRKRPARDHMLTRVGVEGSDGARRSGAAHALVILPTYDEADSLAEVVARVLAAAPDLHVLVVDDASPDGTGELAERLAAADSRISVLRRPAKLGLGSAYIAGFERAAAGGYRWAVEMDADGSHLPEELPRLLAAASAGADLVIGARWVPGGRIVGWPRYRRCISRIGTLVARLALRSGLHDATSGFRVLDTRWPARIAATGITAQGYAFQVGTAWAVERLGGALVEVPITFVERRAGRSKMTIGIVWEALRLVLLWGWRLRFAPDRLPSRGADAKAAPSRS